MDTTSTSASPSSSKVLLGDKITTMNGVPSNYIRPFCERPNLTQVQSSKDSSIPLIDLQELDGPNHSKLIKQIGHACQYDGFFQVRNHGVPEIIIEKMLQVGKEFFRLSESERMKCYSADTSKTTRLSTSFNVTNEKTANWRDFLRLHCYPLEDYIDEWPTNPSSFRSDVAEYCTSVRGLTLKLLGAISESLGLKRDYIEMVLSNHGQHMAINYYPPCPEPELTYGLPGHTDPNAITVLLQDDVPGLQVLKDGNGSLSIRYLTRLSLILVIKYRYLSTHGSTSLYLIYASALLTTSKNQGWPHRVIRERPTLGQQGGGGTQA
ncbi:hypothetical protein C5167_021877 [Papaver somniferum]|uniref:Fe2OG dioxygenase domain-containing protein n=1 Tax=Papaver somniferum TaxID=3469 RepID=A0A4Y7JHU9_PAPSO|nr:hypothetical protein C5167_021877 [Papaver somniferum]